MNERERVLAVLAGEKPDRTPWFGDLSYWYHGREALGTLPDEYAGEEGYLKLHRDTSVGIYLYPPRLWTEETDESVRYTSEKDGNVTVTTISTPAGTLRSVMEYLPDSCSSAYIEHAIKGPEDLEVMRYVYRHRTVRPSFDEFVRIDGLWNGWGLPAAIAPVSVSALQTLIARWAGIETTVQLLMDASRELEDTIHELESLDDGIFGILCDSPARLVCFPENLSGEVTGRRLMEQYEIPCWQKRIKQLHKAGKSVCLHNDGTLSASLPLLAGTALDIVEAVTPAPVGDLTISEIRETAAGRIIIWGCLPGALFSPLYPDDFFDGYVREVLETFPPGSGFVLGVADQVPPDADFARIARVRELVNE